MEQEIFSEEILLKDFPVFHKGEVWIAGAGPGDPGLMTLHSFFALRHADYILYDALVSKECLRYKKNNAKLEFCGKRAGKISLKQEDISARLVTLAQKGLRVLRLKGGDPFLFGRGGEEALVLAKAKIPFRIIPGISAGFAGLSYAGIPITHRDINQNITFLTGHNSEGTLPDFNWEAIAKASPVLVFYMATRFINEIARLLIKAGREKEESVALISKATTKKQKVLVTTLSALVKIDKEKEIPTPAILVIGKIVSFQPILDWFNKNIKENS